MQILVDTGVLLRAFDRSDAKQRAIFRALRKLWSDGHDLVTTAQNIAEFWNVSTRPVGARGGYALPVALVDQRVSVIERLGAILPFSQRAYEEWRRLLVINSSRPIGFNTDSSIDSTSTPLSESAFGNWRSRPQPESSVDLAEGLKMLRRGQSAIAEGSRREEWCE